MPDSAHHQSSFIGGEWSPVSKGRSDLPAYEIAMSVCLNGLPVEEGAWTRRSGFEFIVPTHGAEAAKLLPFYTTKTHLPYVLEMTDLYMRFFVGTAPVFTTHTPTVTASSLAAGILSLTCTTTGFNVGDDVMLWAPATFDPALIGPWRGRMMRVKTAGGGVITLWDETGTAFTGLTSAANVLVNCKLYQIDSEVTPFTGQTQLQALRIVPADTNAFILSQTQFPQFLDVAATPRIANAAFVDGPYLDPQGSLDTPEAGVASARSGSITFTPTTTAFVANDVGRLIRLFSEPAQWDPLVTYAYGATVTYQNEYWVNIAAGTYASSNLNVIPGTSLTSGNVQVTVWAPAPVGGYWSWGTITAQAGTSCTVTLTTNIPLGNSLTMTSWRLGVYQLPNVYPTCGIYSDGRLYLGGAVQNRWDASEVFTNGLSFSPTEPNGQVQDSNAISYTMSSEDPQPISWMSADDKGVLMGTLNAEWLIAPSTLNEAITPTSAKATRVTKYGGLNADPVHIGNATVFIQRYGQRVMEHLAVSAFSSRYGARHLNKDAKHLVTAGVTQIVYQEEKVPVIWCRVADGSLVGCTYRRVSPYMTEAPEAEGWHRQVLGGDYNADLSRPVVSMAVRQNEDALSDLLYVCTTDVNGAHAWIEVLRPIFEDA